MDLMAYLNSAKNNIFRFEYFQCYADDNEALEYWLKTNDVNQNDMREWWNFIEAKNKEGVKMSRVRRVLFPMNDYTKMELRIHELSNQRGDNVMIVLDDEFKKLNIIKKDFWLIDDEAVLEMNYSEDGYFLGFRADDNISEYINIREKLTNNSHIINDVIKLL